MNQSKKNSFTSFHIRQMTGIFLLSMINKYIIYDFLGPVVGFIVFALLVVFWFIGFMGAIRNEEKLIPILGDKFQDWFKNI